VRIVWVLVLCTLLGYSDTKELFLQKLKAQPPLRYYDLWHTYFKPSPLDTKANEIEAEFEVWEGESNTTAIDFSQMRRENIVMHNDTFGVVFVNRDDFYKYGILMDKDAKVKHILLLAYRKGMRGWQIERDVVVAPGKKYLFLVKDEFRDAEWVTYQIKGDMLISDQRYYRVALTPKGRFAVTPTSAKALLKEADTRLNTLYQKVMRTLDKPKRSQLKKIQRAWITYVDAKCSTYLMNATQQPEETLHIQAHKYQCRYDETIRRADELEEIYAYDAFFR
jgi:uncharacterized protein YecT (DUF1311 family)